MVPPVALLAYAPEAPRVSAFWPFAVFSPEWQALAWAAANGVPARFCDLPAGDGAAGQHDDADAGTTATARRSGRRARAADPSAPVLALLAERADPIGQLAAAAGYDDPERWWEDVIEARAQSPEPEGAVFTAIGEAMAELRAGRSGSAVEQRS